MHDYVRITSFLWHPFYPSVWTKITLTLWKLCCDRLMVKCGVRVWVWQQVECAAKVWLSQCGERKLRALKSAGRPMLNRASLLTCVCLCIELFNNILKSSKSKEKITTSLLLAPYSHSNSNSLSHKNDLRIKEALFELLPVLIDKYNIIIHSVQHLWGYTNRNYTDVSTCRLYLWNRNLCAFRQYKKTTTVHCVNASSVLSFSIHSCLAQETYKPKQTKLTYRSGGRQFGTLVRSVFRILSHYAEPPGKFGSIKSEVSSYQIDIHTGKYGWTIVCGSYEWVFYLWWRCGLFLNYFWHIVGSWTFSIAAPLICNSLPDDIISAELLSTFQRNLKRYLFCQSLLGFNFCYWHSTPLVDLAVAVPLRPL